jgi:beta-glucosidase/6-phospho-beta-glucosidase/beta-galactosidase
MKEYGVNAHRMSLSWSRIIPGGGRDSPVNQKGIEFYRKVIQGLLDAGIVSLIGRLS